MSLVTYPDVKNMSYGELIGHALQYAAENVPSRKRARSNSTVTTRMSGAGNVIGARYFARPRRRYYNRRTGGFTGMELKFVDSEETATVSSTPAGAEADNTTMLCLNGIAQGDGENQRDGREVVIKQVMVRGIISLDTAASLAGANTCFIALVHDKQTNGAQFNAEDVYEQPLASNPTGLFRNLEYTGRFRVLKTKQLNMNPMAAAGNGTTDSRATVVKPFNFYHKLNMPVRYTGTGATVANITDNSLHLIIIGTGNMSFAWSSRVRFVG